MMAVLDLFSGIGGFSLGLESTGGFRTIAFCEIDPFCRRVLARHWPYVPIYADIKTLKREDIDEPVDVVCGGFPCQPFSVAGLRRGVEDERHLWPWMLRCVQDFRPAWVLGENVAGFAEMGLESACADLEDAGYQVRPYIIPACAVGAPHRRDRVWIVAHDGRRDGTGQPEGRKSATQAGSGPAVEPQRPASGTVGGPASDADGQRQPQPSGPVGEKRRRLGNGDKAASDFARGGNRGKNQGGDITGRGPSESICCHQDVADAGGHGLQGSDRESCEAQPDVGCGGILPGWDEDWPSAVGRLCRVDDGIPREVDRGRRLKALGNAVVPQVVAEIGRAILAAEAGHA